MKQNRKDRLKNKKYREIFKVFADNGNQALNYKQIASRSGNNDKSSRKLIMNLVLELAEDRILKEERNGRYRVDPKHIKLLDTSLLPKNYLIGIVDMKQTGKAYIIPEDGTEDVFISPNNTNRALHNDKVKIYIFPRRKGRKREGQIVDIIKRDKTFFVGSIQRSSKYAFFVPDSQNMPVDIYIPLEDLNKAKDGEKVLAEMTHWPERGKNPFGKVVKVLGQPGDNDVEMQSILAEYNFPLFFPKKVLNQANKIPTKISPEEMEGRRDFRDITTYTIDPEDAKDFDDAISYRRLENGNHEVGIHIADVSHYVKQGSPIDIEAYERGTSVYLVDRTIPMLPEKLSNEVCSLRPNEDSLTFSVVFELDSNGHIRDTWVGETIIHSNKRMDYSEVKAIIDGEKSELSDYILPVNKLAQKIRDRRFKQGAINFDSEEVKFILDDDAKPIGVYIVEDTEANWLIEEFMLLANKAVAEMIGKPEKGSKGKKAGKTFVYRVHDEPNQDKLSTFTEFVSKMGYKVDTESQSKLAKSLNALFRAISGKGEENMISTIAIRTMSRAYYSTDNIGHYGLAFKHYTHFTSPIRRYPDLMAHRLLKSYLSGGRSKNKETYEEYCEHSSVMERRAVEAERTSIKYKQAEYLSDKVGEEFPGIISGVSKWGIYVEIEENKCEGLVPIRSLTDDFYYIDEDNYQVIGRHYNKKYRLGDKVTIKVEKVDMMKKQMDFSLVEQDK